MEAPVVKSKTQKWSGFFKKTKQSPSETQTITGLAHKWLSLPWRSQPIKAAEWFDRSCEAEVVKVRANGIDPTKCCAENSGPQSMEWRGPRGGGRGRVPRWSLPPTPMTSWGAGGSEPLRGRDNENAFSQTIVDEDEKTEWKKEVWVRLQKCSISSLRACGLWWSSTEGHLLLLMPSSDPHSNTKIFSMNAPEKLRFFKGWIDLSIQLHFVNKELVQDFSTVAVSVWRNCLYSLGTRTRC